MPKGRISRAAIVAGLLLANLALAGCTQEAAPVQERSIAPGYLTGTVTDVALLPIAGAVVSIDGMNATATTDPTGAFEFEVLPGEYVVLAKRAEYRDGALRASVISSQTSDLAFQLQAIPTIVPTLEVQEAEGYLACGAFLDRSGERASLPCGGEDPNDRPTVEFSLGSREGLEGIVVELVWEARTDAAKALRVEFSARNASEVIALGAAEGISPLRVTLAGRLISGDALLATVSPTGAFTDEEAGSDIGFAFQQPFTTYASLFRHQPPPGGYSALK